MLERHEGHRSLTVLSAMLKIPKIYPEAVSVAEIREFFDDDHVHAALIVNGRHLVSVVERGDLTTAAAALPAALFGQLADRVVRADRDLSSVYLAMVSAGRRRLAVVSPSGDLLGLLCLKRTGRGFCSDQDVAARAAERSAVADCAASD